MLGIGINPYQRFAFSFPCIDAAFKIDHIVAFGAQDLCCSPASPTAQAIDVNSFVFVQVGGPVIEFIFVQPVGLQCVVDMTALVFFPALIAFKKASGLMAFACWPLREQAVIMNRKAERKYFMVVFLQK